MATPDDDETPQFDLSANGPVAIIDVLAKQIRHPYEAQKFGEDLAVALRQSGQTRALIDFSGNDYLCSTGFAVLFGLARDLKDAGGELRVCCLHPSVLTGANIIGLGRAVPIFDERKDALKSF